MFNNLKKSRTAFRLPKQQMDSDMLLMCVWSSRHDTKPMLAVRLICYVGSIHSGLSQFLSTASNFNFHNGWFVRICAKVNGRKSVNMDTYHWFCFSVVLHYSVSAKGLSIFGLVQ
jgi:hypothetical protein